MKLGISTASFFQKQPTEMVFDTLNNMKVAYTEVFLNTYSEYTQEFIAPIAHKKGLLDVVSVHALCTQFEPELFNSYDRVRDDAEKILHQVLLCAKTLGSRYYTFHGPLRVKKMQYNLNFDNLSKKINRLCDIAKEYGVNVCYENVHYSYFNSPDFFNNIKTKCPDLKATFDIKHAMQSGINYIKYLNAIGDRLAIVHLCDVQVDNTTCLPYEGIVDFDKLFLDIKQYNSDAYMFLELYSSDYDNLNDVFKVYQQLLTALNNNHKFISFNKKDTK